MSVRNLRGDFDAAVDRARVHRESAGLRELHELFVRAPPAVVLVDRREEAVLLALALYALGTGIPTDNMAMRLGFRTLLLCLSILYVIRIDLPLSEIPIINRWVRE